MKDIISVGESKRQRKTAWLLLALSMCFMLCVFTPMETYILNISEFWYGLGELVPLLLVFFLVCFLLAWAVYFIFSHFRYFYVIFT